MEKKHKLIVEEKKKLNIERQKAVRDAWGKEKGYVAQGKGTRDWLPEQQEEIMKNGHVDGYNGHHMKCVSSYPEHAGNFENIQFLTQDEHINGAHQGNTHTRTNGYYNPDTSQMEAFREDELKPVEAKALSEPCYENGENIKENHSTAAFNASARSAGQGNDASANNFNSSVKNQDHAQKENVSSPKSRATTVSR